MSAILPEAGPRRRGSRSGTAFPASPASPGLPALTQPSIVGVRGSVCTAGSARQGRGVAGPVPGQRRHLRQPAATLPEIKADLLSNHLRRMVAAFPAGALVAGLAAGAATTARLGPWQHFHGAGDPGGPIGLVHSAILVSVVLAGGCCDAMADVGQNAHGLQQRRYGRSIINSLHAVGRPRGARWVARRGSSGRR